MTGPSDERESDHAAERLDEFVRERFPGGLPPEESPHEEGAPDVDEHEDDEGATGD